MVFCRQGTCSLAALRDQHEMLRPRDLGSNTPLGVPYTEEEILFLPRGMYIDAEIDEMLTSRDKMIDEAKEEAKRTRRELELLRGVVRFDDQMSQLLTQLGSHSEIGRGAGVGVVMFRFGRFFTGKLPGKNLENGRPLQVAVQQDFTRGRRHVIRESVTRVNQSQSGEHFPRRHVTEKVFSIVDYGNTFPGDMSSEKSFLISDFS
ncbi:hypothetical protein Tco_0047376 [Tanacetum coccineum]